MRPINFFVMASLLLYCKRPDTKELNLSAEIDGFKMRYHQKAEFYADRYLTTALKQKPTLPHVGSTAIVKYYEIEPTNERVIEAFSSGVTFYIRESDVYFNFPSCNKFKNATLKKLEDLRGLELNGKLSNQFFQKNRSYTGKLLERIPGINEVFSYDSFSIKIGGLLYYVQIIEKQTAYCEGARPVTQILDFIALPDTEQDTTGLKSLCLQVENNDNSVYSFESDGTYDASGFYSVTKAWRFDIDKMTWAPIKSKFPKCYNECAKSCE